MNSLAKFANDLRNLPRVVALKVALAAAPVLTDLAKQTFDAGENAYGNLWAPGEKGQRVTLRRTGDLASFIRYVAIGTKLRVALGTSYAKYQIGKRPVFPGQSGELPTAYVDALQRTAVQVVKDELEVIHEIGVELGKQLASKLCPIPVVDGPEFRPTTTAARERIVIEHDPAGDQFPQPGAGARHRADTNPRTLMTRVQGVKITLYVKNPSAGSAYWEHKRRCDLLLDMVLCALYNVVKTRQNLLAIRSGKFVYADDLKESETPGGAVYELLLTIDRGVADRNWDGTGGPTQDDFVFANQTQVGATDPETACGGS